MMYEHFNMRLHNNERIGMDDPASWTIKTREDALVMFHVGSVDNPIPKPKVMVDDVPGSSGVLDLTESSGRVHFDNKEVTIVLSGEAGFVGMDEIEHLFAPYQGRVIDFTFDNYLDVKWYQTGRMSAKFNKNQNQVILTIDTEPFRYNTSTKYIGSMTVKQDLCRMVYPDENWIIRSSLSDILYNYRNQSDFLFSVEKPGTTIRITRHVAPTSGFCAFGVRKLIGGTVEFLNIDDENHKITFSKTLARVQDISDTTDDPERNGWIQMIITVDGSYYEWHNVNGVARYLPTVKCDFVLSDVLPVDSNWEMTDEVTAELPTNVTIRPDFSNTTAPCVLIVDGIAVDFDDVSSAVLTMPRLTLPGDRADLSGITAKSVFVAVLKTADTTPHPFIAFYPAEVF